MQALLKGSKTFFILFFVSVLLIFVDNLKLLNLPKSAVQFVTIPVQYGLYKSSLAAGRQFQFIFEARKSAQENKALKDQLGTVISDNANLRRELAETQGFAAQQKSLDPQTYSLVPARPVSSERYLIIDKGAFDGLKILQPVVFKDSFLGQIKYISPHQSQVLLSSDPDSKIAAFSSDQAGKARGILIGQFGSEMLLDKVLHEEPIKEGDLVYSEGTEGTLPRGLVLGQVTQVMERANEVFKQAKVKPIFRAGDLDIVFVITN